MGNVYQPQGSRTSKWEQVVRALPAVLFGALEFVLSILLYNRIQPINYNAAGWTALLLTLLQFLVFSAMIGMWAAYREKTISSGVKAGFANGLIAAVTAFVLYFLVFVIYIAFFPPPPSPGSRIFFSPAFIGAVVTSFAAFGGLVALGVSALGGAIGGCIGVVLERVRR